MPTKMLFEIVRKRLGDRVDRNAARVRGDHGAGLAVFFDLGKKLVLDVEIFDDGLDHEIAIFEFCHVVGEIAGRDQLGVIAEHERRGL